ncbi:MAG TPA: hypothetical protein VJ740_15780, partial [Hyphomicrobiaceae bacterium]|nr:hypothetical protein [Hyphomicrobiaceae bacterium]
GLGLLGYVLVKLAFEPAPLVLGFVLGRLMEDKLRQALVLSRGRLMTFIEHPLSCGLLLFALIVVAVAVLPAVRKGREAAFREAG